jgi:hypothetical protein
MAHYALLNDNNIVTAVYTGIDENELIDGVDPETWYGQFHGQRCIRTSYNGRIRKQYAGVGYTYDEKADVFVAPSPFPSWQLDNNHDWKAPVAYPTDGQEYHWDESTISWVPVE